MWARGDKMIKLTGDSRLVPNFTVKEMASRGDLFIDAEVIIFMQMAQELRDWAALIYPIFENDGLIVSNIYRTKDHNNSVGGAKNSAHLNCRAMDVINIPRNDKMIQAFTTAWQTICAMYNKIGGVEIGKDYMHFDNYSDKFGYKKFRIVDKR